MTSPRTFFLLLVALLVFCFGLAAGLAPRFQALESSRHQSDNFFSLLLGDSSRMFANSFFIKADAYYHSGYYPTIFDNNEAFKTPHVAEDTGAVNSQNHGEETDFMGHPRDWIDAFGRHFIPNRHTHLDEGGPTDDLSTSDNVREILPWLKLSAELNPDDIRTYTVTAYWLRRMHKEKEAEQVLREGLRNNPQSYEILFELGRLYKDSYDDAGRARNVWELAVRYWFNLSPDEQKENRLILEQITTNLGKLETDADNWPQAMNWLHLAQKVSLTPGLLQEQIDGIKWKMSGQPSPLFLISGGAYY
jgi:tetratricopeptide (TPR) repeat protein